ncbi:MAG: dksA [Blastococcus sp.]|jgi:RNA polymerase-binding transcription factor DksA|nr:dksA [Blastococcus sp.]
MSASIDTTPATGWDRFRALLEAQRTDCLQQREAALAECAQSVPDPVAQRRSADLQLTIAEIDKALVRIAAGTYGTCDGCGASIPEERLELRPMAGRCVSCSAAA